LIDLGGDIAQRGQDVVLDAGFWHKARRVSARERLHARGLTTVLHYLELPDGERWTRLEQRNRALPEGEYEITRAMFEHFASCFEPPGVDESPVPARPKAPVPPGAP
jgi:predicted kinase